MSKQNKIRNVNVVGLCRLILNEEVTIGDRFIVRGSLHDDSLTQEIIYNLQNGLYADTIISHLGNQPCQYYIGELRYFAAQGYRDYLGNHKKGIKSHHSLLKNDVSEEIKQ